MVTLFQVKPTEVSSVDLQTLCQAIQERLLEVPSHPRSLLNDLEICIGGTDSVTSAGNTSIAEISLTREMISLIGHWLGNEERVKTLISCTPVCDGASLEQLSEQLFRGGTYRWKLFEVNNLFFSLWNSFFQERIRIVFNAFVSIHTCIDQNPYIIKILNFSGKS